jgi:hypothetical protein
VGWYFGAIRTSKRREIGSAIGLRLRHLETRPAPVFFVSPGVLLAGIVQEPLRDAFPDGVAAAQADRIDGLDFDGPLVWTPATDRCFGTAMA